MRFQFKYLIYGAFFMAGGLAFFATTMLYSKWSPPIADPGPVAESEASQAPSEDHGAHPLVKETEETTETPEEKSVAIDSKEIFQNTNLLRAYVKKFGLDQSIRQLHQLTALYGDCHQPAHLAGRFAYKVSSKKVFQSFQSECHSGGLHGAIEAYFMENGIENFSNDVDLICRPELNHFFYHQCIHGIGHGLMAWSNYELLDVLKYCDRLKRNHDSCWSGAFMENVVGGLGGHHAHGKSRQPDTKYLSADPHYPCKILEDKYKGTCYFYQTSRMMTLFRGDFSKIASACAETTESMQVYCYESMGRDVGGVHRGDPQGAIKACSTVTSSPSRIHCLTGAVQDSFWDPSGQDQALHFCRLLTEETGKDDCYTTIFSRAQQVLASKDDLKRFCGKSEASYRGQCSDLIR